MKTRGDRRGLPRFLYPEIFSLFFAGNPYAACAWSSFSLEMPFDIPSPGTAFL